MIGLMRTDDGGDRIRRGLGGRWLGGLRSVVDRALSALQWALDNSFPLHPVDTPPPPTPVASAGALREGALLSENIRAVAERDKEAA